MACICLTAKAALKFIYIRFMKPYSVIFIFFLLFFSCTTIFGQSQNNTANIVVVLPINIQVPTNAKKLGTIKLGNNNTQTRCRYDELVAQAKVKAIELGGNIVKIRELIAPVFISKCYKIEADIFSCNPLPHYDIKQDTNTAMVTHLADTAKYALVYVYRFADTLTFQPRYDLYMDDSVVGHVKSRFTSVLKVYQSGTVTFSAKTESKVSLPMKVDIGKIYFLRCGTASGSFRQIPFLEEVPYPTGIKEYQKLSGSTQKDVDISYLKEIHEL